MISSNVTFNVFEKNANANVCLLLGLPLFYIKIATLRKVRAKSTIRIYKFAREIREN